MSAQLYCLRDGRELILRAPTVADAAVMAAYPKRIGVETDFLLCDENGIPGLDEESERAYIRDTLRRPNTAMFVGFVGDRLVCLCDVRGHLRPRTAHNADLSITVLREFWHMGVGSLCMQTMIDYAEANPALKNLRLEVHADNVRAQELYARFGFTVCGRHTDALYVKGVYHDELLMERRV